MIYANIGTIVENYECAKHYGVVDVNNMDITFACRLCANKLILMHRKTLNDAKIDNMVTYLKSFNIDRVNVVERHEVDEIKFVISNVMDDQSITDM